jgi:hypothetical protein
MADLSKLDTGSLSDDGVEMAVKSPVDGSVVGYITLRGADSKTARESEAKWKRKIPELLKDKNVDIEAESEKHAAEYRAVMTVSIREIEYNGNPVTDPAELYNKPGLKWLTEQVDRFIQDRRNFFPKA